MQIEEAKKDLNNLIFTLEIKHLGGAEAIETVLNHIEKIEAELNNTITRKKYRQTKKTLKGQIRESNAVIDEMAGWINKIDSRIFCDKEKCDDNCKECVKEYFYKKVSDNK